MLAGGKLSKYDGLLNLVKEVEIKGGPSPKKMDKMKSEETAHPADDAEINAMLDQEPPGAQDPNPNQ